MSSLPNNTVPNNKTLIRKIGLALLCIYFVLGAVLLLARYWLPAHIDNWRPQIQSRLSSALGLDVSLGQISLDWHGWNPTIAIDQLRFKHHNGNQLLQVPKVKASLYLPALLQQNNGLLQLDVYGMDLTIARQATGDLDILGQTVSLDNNDTTATNDFAWLLTLLQQPKISFLDSTILWHDELRSAPDLYLRNVHAVLNNNDYGLDFYLNAAVPQAAYAGLRLYGHLDNTAINSIDDLTKINTWLQLSRFQPDLWGAWFDIPEFIAAGLFDLQLWFDGRNGPAVVTAMASGSNVFLADASQTQVRAGKTYAWVRAAYPDMLGLLAANKPVDDINFASYFKNLSLKYDEALVYPVNISNLKVTGDISRAENLKLNIQDLKLQNPDISLQLAGSWSDIGHAGWADIDGDINYANLGAIYKYMPLEVNADAREWLRDGLLAGDLAEAKFYLRGDLYEFPFGGQPESGDFKVWGDFTNAQLDFVPDAEPMDRWPQMFNMSGTASLHRSSLNLTADRALMSPSQGKTIELYDLQGEIPDIEYESVLYVSGQSAASAGTYMDLLKNTPLSYMLNGIFDEAQASGKWQVPLSLEVPLEHSIDTKVDGLVNVIDGSLQFLPQAPVFTNTRGYITFNENGVSIKDKLHANLFNGPVTVTGGLGVAGAKGINFAGVMDSKAIASFVAVPGMSRITGSVKYNAVLYQQDQGYVFDLKSDTNDLQLDFPAPLSKPIGERQNLHVQWSDTDKNDDSILISYGDVLRLSLLHKRGQNTGPYFHTARVGINRAYPADTNNGLFVDVKYPLLDLDHWDAIIDEFSANPESGQKSRIFWPDLTMLAVQADQLRMLGNRLDNAVLRVENKSKTDWSTIIRSDQTTGTLKWQEQSGKILGAVSANFERLSVGDDPDDNNSLLPNATHTDISFKEDIDIPAINLKAQELVILGHSLGYMALEGTRNKANKSWQLERLRIGDDNALLRGTGTWYLSGADRGLQITANIEINDFGGWMDRAGWENIIAGGKGNIKGKINWHNLPWQTDKADLQADIQSELKDGRFVKLGSNTGKLLELLSLQSITRLTKLEKSFGGLAQDGFPFDDLYGDIKLANGTAVVKDYKVIGSVGTILLDGDLNIIKENINMQAVVVPNLDVSGAAIAAGIAINPLVGLGAFITQWLLKTPLAKSMTVRYLVTGPWSDPVVKEVPIEAKK